MFPRYRMTVFLIVLVLVGIAIGYRIVSQNSTSSDRPSVKIGVLLPLSGPAAYYGESARKGMELAKEEMQRVFPKIAWNVIYEDSQYTAKGGVDGYNKLRSSDRIDGVIVGASQVALAVQPLAQRDGIPEMAVFASADKYSTPNDLTLRVSTRNDVEVETLIRVAQKIQPKRLAIMYLNNDFGVGFRDAFKRNANKSGFVKEIVAEEGFVLATTDFRTLLTKIKATNPDMVLMVGTANHYVAMLKQAKELGLTAQFIAPRGAEDPIVLKEAASFAEGLIYSYPFDAQSSNEQIKQFVQMFQARHQVSPEAYAAEGYEGFRWLANGLATCGKERACLQKELLMRGTDQTVFGTLKMDAERP